MMSTPEFFGVFLGLAMAIATIVFMMIGYASAMQQHFRQMLLYLRMAGFLSLGCWLTMTAVIVKYNKDYSVQKAAKVFHTDTETRIVGQGIVSPKVYSVTTPSGANYEWEMGDGVRRGRRGGVAASDTGGRSGNRYGGSDYGLQFSTSATADRGDGGSSLPRTESEDGFRI